MRNQPQKNPAQAPGQAGSKRPACGGLEGDTFTESEIGRCTAKNPGDALSIVVIFSRSTSPWRTSTDPSARANSRMSGSLLVRFEAKDIRSQQTKKHQARLRNSIFSPTGNRPRFYSAKPGHFIGSTKRIDDLVRVHLHIVRHTLRDCKPYLINNSLGLPNDHMA